MDREKVELQKILDSLPSGEWDNPQILSWDEETRIVYTLVAKKPGSSEMYYYDTDSGQFEPVDFRPLR